MSWKPDTSTEISDDEVAVEEEIISSVENSSTTRRSGESRLIDEHLLNYAYVEKTEIKTGKRKGRMRYKEKRGYCLYCDIYTSQIARHCIRKHKDETLVVEAMNLEKTKDTLKQRREAWGYIRNMGNSIHNDRVYEGKENDLIVKRRVARKVKSAAVTQYVPCKHCRAYIKSDSLWSHKKSCRKSRESMQRKGKRHVKEGRMLLPLPKDISRLLANEIRKMRPDVTTLVAKSDKHILEVGQRQLNQSNSFRAGRKAREKMRTLGHLLISARKRDSRIKTSADLVRVRSFNTDVKCALEASGYDAQKNTHMAYSTALRIGHAIQDLARAVETSYILASGKDSRSLISSDNKVKDLKKFMRLMQNGTWSGKVNASALRQGQRQQWKAPKLIPLTRDVISFHQYLHKEEAKVRSEIEKNGMTLHCYKILTEVTLAQVVLFNRRRPAEIEEIEMKDYEHQVNRPLQVQDEVMKCLKIPEKIGLNKYKILMVRGKRGRGVPVLLTKEMKDSMDKVANFNKARDVEQKYIFARVSDEAETPMSATNVIARLAKSAIPQLEQPACIRPTKLRKQLATLSQVINMKKK